MAAADDVAAADEVAEHADIPKDVANLLLADDVSNVSAAVATGAAAASGGSRHV